MKKILFTILTIFPIFVQAQKLSIAQLWKEVDKNLIYQQDLLKRGIKIQELKELRNTRIPVFYIDANLQRNLIIPTTPVPAIAFDPNALEGAILPLKFATKWSSKAGIQMEWNLFDPKRKLDEKQKSFEIQKEDINKEQHIQEWKKNATLAYASVVLATQQYELALQDSASYNEILKISKARYEAGRLPSSQYLNAQQEYEQHLIGLYDAWSVLEDADLELRKYTDLAQTQSLNSNIEEICSFVKNLQQENYTIKSLELDQQINKLQMQGVKKQLLPTLSTNAYLGKQYFSNEFRLDRGHSWYGNSYINLVLRIPLSAYFTAQPTLKKEILNSGVLELQLHQEQQIDQINAQQQIVKIKTAQQKLFRFHNIEQLAAQEKKEQESRYREGRSMLSDYNQSILSYHKAKQNVWQAEFDLIKLLLDKIGVNQSN
ncbi:MULTISPECIES: TolC family protein [Sphingobacterium]|uniref:TolC family protein n=1 Tax=Sphingobacterium TaxID=28453 RepID=UPI00143A37AB|nr:MULTISPECIES: TolC family protein [unclassified Sphingobacterium]MBB2952301.1 outer membrane protein TolC [Sphingobacterium sp. JUb56]NJI75714.1 TolC family protein [Sphingobacterium sp. B16(2022)]